MADVSKAQKLASARKKFKELKKEKKKNAVQKSEENVDFTSNSSKEESNELPNYFSNVNSNEYQHPAAFFDSFVQNNETVESATEVKEDSDICNFHTFDSVNEPIQPQPIDLSSMESLRQISEQMSHLLENPTETYESQLESRNQELAALLSQEKQKSTQLEAITKEYELQIHQLQEELKQKELNINGEVDTNLIYLQDQLQCHQQTVSILVNEKNELSANLTELQIVYKQKTEECEELQGRLKTSRSRVADLEREIAVLRTEKSQFDHLGKEQINELEKMKNNYFVLKEERDQIEQELLEMKEKLKNVTEENVNLQEKIIDLSNQLSMAGIKIQQLSNEGQNETDCEKLQLQKQIDDLNETVKILTKEKDESNLQYQQYVQQLNAQICNLNGKIDKLQKDNESLQIQEQNRIQHIGELEKQLQMIQINNNNNNSNPTNDNSDVIEKLKLENLELEENIIQITTEKEMLLKEIESKNESIKTLEGLIEDLKNNQPDNAKLLATIESDKIAARTAVSQNTELKKQMESMQEVYLKVNDDKMELVERLNIEQRNNKELLEKLQKTELHLQTLTQAIEIKDKELQSQAIQNEQLNDRLRHYEADDHSVESLKIELQQANQQIVKLTEKSDSNHNNLDRESAMKHLETKFLKTMEDIANLTEEKQRLEHLVLQLQSETETIGEYVALYQHQRSLLKQKAIEKDQQLNQLANDRELMKSKLEKLNDLVKKLVTEKGVIPNELLEHHQDNHLCEEHAKINNEINKIAKNFTIEPNDSLSDKQTTETAEKIIELLSEIKSSNLIQPTENLHHCPWCSGQLITV